MKKIAKAQMGLALLRRHMSQGKICVKAAIMQVGKFGPESFGICDSLVPKE